MNRSIVRSIIRSSLLTGLLCFLAESAAANVYDLTYSTLSGDSANLVLTTQNTLTTDGYGSGYEITGVTGTRDGIAVAGLSSAFSADQLLFFPSGPFFDYGGFTYDTGAAGNPAYGVYWANADRVRTDPGSYLECFAAGCGFGTVGDNNIITSLKVTAVPEPDSYVLTLAGLLFLGFTAHRCRTLPHVDGWLRTRLSG